MWEAVTTAPFDREVEVAVIDGDGPHALVFPCRRVTLGWIDAQTNDLIDVQPTHWRAWSDDSLPSANRDDPGGPRAPGEPVPKV